jgi:hypothetical protein
VAGIAVPDEEASGADLATALDATAAPAAPQETAEPPAEAEHAQGATAPAALQETAEPPVEVQRAQGATAAPASPDEATWRKYTVWLSSTQQKALRGPLRAWEDEGLRVHLSDLTRAGLDLILEVAAQDPEGLRLRLLQQRERDRKQKKPPEKGGIE